MTAAPAAPRPPAKDELAELEQLAAALMAADTTAARLRARMYAIVLDLYQAGVRPIRIAEAAGVTRQRIQQIIVAAESRARRA